MHIAQNYGPLVDGASCRIEDCVDKITNRFDLVLLASHRVRALTAGGLPCVPRDNDKNTVIALREIAESFLRPVDLKEELVHSLQKHVEVDEPETEEVPKAVNTESLLPRRTLTPILHSTV